MSENDAPAAEPRSDHGELEKENEDLRSKVQSLEIDKAVRDRMLDQMKEDRQQLLGQLEGHVQTMIEQGRTIGKLETRLALALPEGDREDDKGEYDAGSTPAGYDSEAVENDEADRYRI